MKLRGATPLMVAIAAGLIDGCGGGGSDAPPTPASATAGESPPADGNYAGAYTCTNLTGHDGGFTAVLATATGAFSSCAGAVDNNTLKFSCTGTIGADGTFRVDAVDTARIASSYAGTATARQVSGTFSAPSANVFGTFGCTH